MTNETRDAAKQKAYDESGVPDEGEYFEAGYNAAIDEFARELSQVFNVEQFVKVQAVAKELKSPRKKNGE